MPSHTEEREGNLPSRTQIQTLMMSSPSMMSWVCQLLATLCVTLSLALFALCGADPTGRFCLRTLSSSRPTTIMGGHFGYGYRIPRCRGHDKRVVGEVCKHIQRPLLHSAKVHCLAALVVTPRDYENQRLPLCTLMSSH
jgi:hypothetical protein